MSGFLSSLFYFVFGYIFCLFVGVVITKKKPSESIDDSDNQSSSIPRFYVNIFLTNGKEVVENIVRSKVSKRRVVLRALAKRLAVNLVSDETLIGRIANELLTVIPSKLALKGVRSECNIAYKQSAFICIEVLLPSVDIVKIIEVFATAEASIKFSKLLDRIGIPLVTNMIESFTAKLVMKKIMSQLPQIIQEKLEDKLIADVDVFALTEEEQGPFLIQTIQNLNEEKNQNSTKETSEQ